MKFLLAATFKSNKTADETAEWITKVNPHAAKSVAEVVVIPSAVYLKDSKRYWKNALAAQDVSPFPPGSYTGAINARQLADLGVKYCLVGHSERRRYFHETSADVANKVRELVAAGITPIVCLSEEEIASQLSALEQDLQSQSIFCFEPPSDIGGTDTAPIHEIERVIKRIRESVDMPLGVMYGGSVNSDNIASLLPLPIDGVLVSTASLEAESFIQILNAYEAAKN